MPEAFMPSGSDSPPSDISDHYMPDYFFLAESERCEEDRADRSNATFYYLLSHLPDKKITDFDATRGWRSVGTHCNRQREHLICTFKALNFDYASIVYIAWLASVEDFLPVVRWRLTCLPLEALNAKWFRDAVRFYSLHVVNSYGEQVATTIDTPGVCAFHSIESSLPDFGLLQGCLFAQDWGRTSSEYLRFPDSRFFDVDDWCAKVQEDASFIGPSDILDERALSRVNQSNADESSSRLHFLQRDCSTLEPQNRKGYSKEEFEAYLRSFDGDDGLTLSDTDIEVYTPAVQDENAEEDKKATLALLTELKRKYRRRRTQSSG